MSSGPSVLVAEALQVELGGAEPWPKDVQLFQPYAAEQILLNDNANCLAVQAYLHMAQLEFSIETRANAEHMSPSGRVPFIRANNFVIAELDPIVAFINTKGISLTEHLDSVQKGDMRVYMNLVNNVLGNAELFISWNDNVTLEEVTKPRYGSAYPWPINSILTWEKKRSIMKKLTAMDWGEKSLDQVYSEVENCCHSLSERIEDQKYFFNNRPTELDALVFGHLYTIITTPLPDNRLATIVKGFKNLVDLCERIDKDFFDGMSSSGSSENFEKIM